MITDLRAQLIERLYCILSSLDESTDVKDTAQLAIFTHGVYSNLCVTEGNVEYQIDAWDNNRNRHFS